MSTDAARPVIPVNPKPGIVQALGVMNIVIALLISACASLSTGWFLVAVRMSPATVELPSPVVSPPPTTPAPPAGAEPAPPTPPTAAVSGKPAVNSTITMNPMMGMDDPSFVNFCVLDLLTALVVNLAMFASGIGLVNYKRWGARWSIGTAWAKIARLVLLWGGFVVLVGPTLAASMAKNVIRMIPPNARGPGPDQAMLTQVYSVTWVVVALAMIGLGVIYPAISIWVATRPGFRAALVSQAPMMERTQP